MDDLDSFISLLLGEGNYSGGIDSSMLGIPSSMPSVGGGLSGIDLSGIDDLSQVGYDTRSMFGSSAVDVPWYTQANDWLRGLNKGIKDYQPLIGLGVGGLGAFTSYLDARQRNKLMRQQLASQEARRAALDAEKSKYNNPVDYRLALQRVSSPVEQGGMAQYFSNNALSANTGVPRMASGGFLEGHTSGQDDKVPALLSDGEYVIDADVVSALGDGNNAAGAKKLDSMREAVRSHKRSTPADKIPPKAKQPLAYLKKGKK